MYIITECQVLFSRIYPELEFIQNWNLSRSR